MVDNYDKVNNKYCLTVYLTILRKTATSQVYLFVCHWTAVLLVVGVWQR